MLDRADEMLRQWVCSALGEVKFSSAAPARAEVEGTEIGLYLMDVAPKPSPRGPRRPPVQFTLRYLLSTWSRDPSEARHSLGVLMLEAMKSTAFEVEAAPPPAQMWLAFGVPPRPALLLRVVVSVPWEEPVVPPPRVVQVDTSPLRLVRGAVLRGDGSPAAGATVEFPSLGLRTRADGAGAFALSAPGGEPVRLRAWAGPAEAVFPRTKRPAGVDAGGGDSGEPLIIHVAGMED